MSSDYPLYEGDGIIHAQRQSAAFETAGPAKSLAALISRFVDWIERGIQRAKYRELERYLAKSTDLADLEHRIRRIESEPRNIFPVG